MRRTVMVVATVGFLLTLRYLIEAIRYPLGTAGQPGPGLYPLLAGGLLMLGFVGAGLEALVSESKSSVEWPVGGARWRVLAITGAIFAYAILLPYLGHAIMGTLLTLAVFETMRQRSWTVKILLSLIIGVGSYFLFVIVLGVPLPMGSLFE